MPLCDQYSSYRNVYDMPLKCSWNVVCWNGSSCQIIGIEFNLIQIKTKWQSHWSPFKFNSNIVESCIFGKIIFSWSFFIYYLLFLELVWIFYEFPKFGVFSGISGIKQIEFNSFNCISMTSCWCQWGSDMGVPLVSLCIS